MIFQSCPSFPNSPTSLFFLDCAHRALLLGFCYLDTASNNYTLVWTYNRSPDKPQCMLPLRNWAEFAISVSTVFMLASPFNIAHTYTYLSLSQCLDARCADKMTLTETAWPNLHVNVCIQIPHCWRPWLTTCSKFQINRYLSVGMISKSNLLFPPADRPRPSDDWTYAVLDRLCIMKIVDLFCWESASCGGGSIMSDLATRWRYTM